MPSNRLKEIAPRVQAICEEHGLPYNSGPFWQQWLMVQRAILRYALPGGAERAKAEPYTAPPVPEPVVPMVDGGGRPARRVPVARASVPRVAPRRSRERREVRGSSAAVWPEPAPARRRDQALRRTGVSLTVIGLPVLAVSGERLRASEPQSPRSLMA